jgi:hypothetical protein
METHCNTDHGKFEFEEFFSKKIVKLRSFYIHAFIYAIGLTIYVLKEYYGVPLNFFPARYLNSVVMVIWTSVFLFSAIDLFTSIKIFGEKWEQRKMKSILEKKIKKQKWE